MDLVEAAHVEHEEAFRGWLDRDTDETKTRWRLSVRALRQALAAAVRPDATSIAAAKRVAERAR